MKKLSKSILVMVIAFLGFTFQAQAQAQTPTETETLYQTGYATGQNLAEDCDLNGRVKQALYNNTISANFSTEYKNGFREGYNSNSSSCLGVFTNNATGQGIYQSAAEFYCQTAELFCGDVNTSGGVH